MSGVNVVMYVGIVSWERKGEKDIWRVERNDSLGAGEQQAADLRPGEKGKF